MLNLLNSYFFFQVASLSLRQTKNEEFQGELNGSLLLYDALARSGEREREEEQEREWKGS